MQLGYVSAILPTLDLEAVFSIARNIGYDCVEVMCWPPGKADRRYAGITHIDVADLTRQRADDILALAEKHRVSISGLGYYPNLLSPQADEAERARAHLQQVIAASRALGVGVVNTFVGRDWQLSVDENWPRFLEVWKPLIACADDHDVRVGIENCPMLFTRDEWPGGKNLARSPAIWRRMFHDIPSPRFGLNYDPSHMVLQQMDYLNPLREFADRIVHVHAKDLRMNVAQLDEVGMFAYPNEYHSPKLPGLGDVDWGRFFSALTDTGYQGPVCVEVEDRAYEGTLEKRQASLRQSLTYLRNFIPAASPRR